MRKQKRIRNLRYLELEYDYLKFIYTDRRNTLSNYIMITLTIIIAIYTGLNIIMIGNKYTLIHTTTIILVILVVVQFLLKFKHQNKELSRIVRLLDEKYMELTKTRKKK